MGQDHDVTSFQSRNGIMGWRVALQGICSNDDK
jgi:hypothetical protein